MRKKFKKREILQYNKFINILSKHGYKQKEKFTMSKQIIEKKVNEILESLNYKYDGGELDIVKVAQDLGFVVGLSKLPDYEEGFILVDESQKEIQHIIGIPAKKVIGVNVAHEQSRKRFTIAHEIGHYVLHSNEKSYFAHREAIKGKDENENEADFFAACLLMPKQYFEKKYHELSSKNLSKMDIIILLQKYFNVPWKSVERRIKEIEGGN